MTNQSLTHVTHEKIVLLHEDGLSYAQIAKRLRCNVWTIFARLRKARKSDPKIAKRDTAQRTCKCGRRKRPYFTECSWCRYKKSRPQWDSGDAVQQALRLVEEQPEAQDRRELNAPCPCGRSDEHGNPRIASGPNRCILCEGTSEKLDRLMAAERGISIESLRKLLEFRKCNPRLQEVVA
jgi:hypothetical protein